MADRPPEHVYVICVTTEWPIRIIDADQSGAVQIVESIVDERLRSGNVGGDRSYVKIFRARLTDVEEMELQPSRKVDATLQPKETG